MRHFVWITATFCSVFAAPAICSAVLPQDFDDAQLEFFEKKVRPLLVEHCYECHGPDATPIQGGLSLASRKAILAGGETGPAIVPGEPDESLFIDAINYGDVYEMPPDSKLSDDDIETFRKWVDEGAPWPEESVVDIVTQDALDIAERVKQHWCWQPIRSIEPPSTTDKESIQPIDRFINTRLESAGLKPASRADRKTVIRRMYMDLIGIPPTPGEIQSALADNSPEAFNKLVDQLLASPRFGERWARHWMDLTRYAETCGHEFDYPIPHAYQYRDYLIRAFNSDVPYDQLIVEHLAGDLLPEPRRHQELGYNESIIGTGFWFLGEATHGPVDVKGDEAGHVDNRIDVMSKAFLGLTVACARCHDHKFDAISTEDYYALSGYLQSSRRQLAMLDPDHKIENAWQKCRSLGTQAKKLILQVMSAVDGQDENQLAATIHSALEVLRNDPTWNLPEPITFQGEALPYENVANGKILKQKLNPRGQYKWQGNQHLFWINGQPGDRLQMAFDVPDNRRSGQKFKIDANLTLAPDYAQVQLYVDDQPVGKELDLYDQSITVQSFHLGEVELNPGKHTLAIEIIGKNEKAVPKFAAGIDFLKLTPVVGGNFSDFSVTDQIKKLAQKHSVSEAAIQSWMTAIQSAQLERSSHPLHLLRVASRQDQTVDSETTSQWKQQLDDQSKRHQQFLDQSDSFQSFADGIPEDWFQTGLALDRHSDGSMALSVAGPQWLSSGTAGTSRLGKQFCGVLYSPTFEINHPRIHIRARGQNVTIRLIIDGFVMDVYNPLLFNGCRQTINSPDQFRWFSLAQDVGNYLGHRAHIELIDHGDGFFEIDQIRTSNQDPVDQANSFSHKIVDRPIQDLADLSQNVARQIIQSANGTGVETAECLSFLVANGLFDDATAVSSQRGKTLSESISELRQQIANSAAAAPQPMFAVAMIDGTPEDEFVFVRGNHKTLGTKAARRFLEAFEPTKPSTKDEWGSGRFQLAKKIASPDNPLTARVAVNRIWHHLMGRGIVASVDNFGVLGAEPSHADLLDYLATQFIQDRWSIKRLIRRIMLSDAYQRSSQPPDSAKEIDPENLLLHSARVKRLQGEVIRDSILHCSAELDDKMFGPPVAVYLTPFMSGRGRPGKSGPLNGDGRRSIYIEVRRNFLSPMMLAFDTPIPFNAIGRRNQSNVPAQALILMNDPFVVEQSQRWAEKLVVLDQTVDARIQSIYETAIGRPPRKDEFDAFRSFVQQQADELGLATENQIMSHVGLWADVCHVVFNVKDFIFIH